LSAVTLLRLRERDLADRFSGANLVYGIQFGRQEPAPLLDEARKRAIGLCLLVFSLQQWISLKDAVYGKYAAAIVNS